MDVASHMTFNRKEASYPLLTGSWCVWGEMCVSELELERERVCDTKVVVVVVTHVWNSICNLGWKIWDFFFDKNDGVRRWVEERRCWGPMGWGCWGFGIKYLFLNQRLMARNDSQVILRSRTNVISWWLEKPDDNLITASDRIFLFYFETYY